MDTAREPDGPPSPAVRSRQLAALHLRDADQSRSLAERRSLRRRAARLILQRERIAVH